MTPESADSIKRDLDRWFEDCTAVEGEQADILAEQLLSWDAPEWIDENALFVGLDFLNTHVGDTGRFGKELEHLLRRVADSNVSVRVGSRARGYLLVFYRDTAQIMPLVQLVLENEWHETLPAVTALQEAYSLDISGSRGTIARLLRGRHLDPETYKMIIREV